MHAAGLKCPIDLELIGPGKDPLAVVADEHIVASCRGKLLWKVVVDLLDTGSLPPWILFRCRLIAAVNALVLCIKEVAAAASDHWTVILILATTSIVEVLNCGDRSDVLSFNSQSFLVQDAREMVVAVGNPDDLVGLLAEVGDGRALLASVKLAPVAHNLAGCDGAVDDVSVVVSVLQKLGALLAEGPLGLKAKDVVLLRVVVSHVLDGRLLWRWWMGVVLRRVVVSHCKVETMRKVKCTGGRSLSE